MTDDRVVSLARAIAGAGLPTVPRREPQVVSAVEWTSLLSRIHNERITGLAVESVADGWLDLTDEQTDQLLEVHREAMTWSLSVERKLVRLADSFAEAGIGFAVLKGASIAHTMYPEPCLRSFADLDVLVRTGDYEQACAFLARLGHVRRRPEPRPGFETRFGKASVHKHPEDGVELDLHRTLVLGPFGLWIRPEELLERRTAFEVGGRWIDRLDDTGLLLNVAMHASLGWRPPLLVPLRDVLQVASRGRIDWGRLDRWTKAWHLEPVMQHAFSTARETLHGSLPPEAERFVSFRPSRGQRRLMEAHTGSRRERGGTAVATLRAIPGMRSKAAYLSALLVPDRQFLRARSLMDGDPSYRHRWGVAIRRFVGSRREV